MKTYTGRKKRSIPPVLGSFFLVLYFFSGPPFDFIHAFSHPEHGLHGAAHEQDCEHDTHILTKEHCYRCYCNVHLDLLLPDLISFDLFDTTSSGFHCYTTRTVSAIALIVPARAPPLLL